MLEKIWLVTDISGARNRQRLFRGDIEIDFEGRKLTLPDGTATDLGTQARLEGLTLHTLIDPEMVDFHYSRNGGWYPWEEPTGQKPTLPVTDFLGGSTR